MDDTNVQISLSNVVSVAKGRHSEILSYFILRRGVLICSFALLLGGRLKISKQRFRCMDSGGIYPSSQDLLKLVTLTHRRAAG